MRRLVEAAFAYLKRGLENRPWWQAWAIGVGGTGMLYALGSLRMLEPHVLSECALDRLIGYHPGATGLYISFFVMQALAFYAVPASQRAALTGGFLFCAATAFCVFVFWPTTLVQPAVGAATSGLGLVRLFDTPANCLPSLHAALSVLSAAALSVRASRLRAAGATVWAIAICWSAIATRQHLSIDISAGAALGGCAAWVFLLGPFRAAGGANPQARASSGPVHPAQNLPRA
jgi:membrane-associated phospholipid phosphatase